MSLSGRFPNPKDEARKAAKLIFFGVLSLVFVLVVSFVYLYFLKVMHSKAKTGPLFLIIIGIGGLSNILATFLILAGTVLGFHAIYRLIKLRESWGLAWVSIIALPLMILLLLIMLAGFFYRGP